MNTKDRRKVLKALGLAGAYTGGLGFSGLPALSFAQESTSCNSSNGTLVVIFQRGANDGMNMLIPNPLHADSGAFQYYQDNRKFIKYSLTDVNSRRITAAGAETGFSYNKKLSALKPLIDNNQVAFFPGTHVGSTKLSDENKFVGNMSHFTAQDIMEIGGHGNNYNELIKRLRNASKKDLGWIARSVELGQLPKPLEGEKAPLKVFGFESDLSLQGLKELGFLVSNNPNQGLPNLYAGNGHTYQQHQDYLQEQAYEKINSGMSASPLGRTWQDMQKRFFETVTDLSGLSYRNPHNNSGGYKVKTEGNNVFFTPMGKNLSDVATLINGYPELELVTINQGDYDTHSDQKNRQEGLLDDLSVNLAAFANDVQNVGRPVEVLVITEFGRTFDDNNSGGTDHGQAFTAMALSLGSSSGVTAPVIYGRRENYTLINPPRFENDLIFRRGARLYTRPIQDYRDIISEIFNKRNIGCRNPFVDLDPDYSPIHPEFLV